MRSPEGLRDNARGLLERARGFIDPTLRRELASRAFELAQLAESIAELAADSERREPRSNWDTLGAASTPPTASGRPPQVT